MLYNRISKKDILYYIVIDDYPTQVLLSKARRTKYRVNSKGENIVSNKAYAGKPRYRKVSGQDLWAMSISRFVKGKIAHELKTFYYEKFRGLEPIDKYPVGIYLKYSGPTTNKPDLDNLNMFHLKCIQDAFCGNVSFLREKSDAKRGWKLVPDHKTHPPLIPDDKIAYINEVGYGFEKAEKDRLTIIVYKNN